VRRLILASTFSILAACGAAERPEPPSGAVDPGPAGLATPGERAAPPSASPESAAPAAIGALPGPLPGLAPPAAPRPAEPEATGSVVMTREHCATLGRKFAELTMAQGGRDPNGSVDREAENVGKTFADRCSREMVGQTVSVAEYQCMLRAKAATELLGCKR
jgi:hypothetical protein